MQGLKNVALAILGLGMAFVIGWFVTPILSHGPPAMVAFAEVGESVETPTMAVAIDRNGKLMSEEGDRYLISETPAASLPPARAVKQLVVCGRILDRNNSVYMTWMNVSRNHAARPLRI